MTYRPRPYGLGAYGDDLYSQYRQPDLAPAWLLARSGSSGPAVLLRDRAGACNLQARSGARAVLNEDAVARVGVLAGRSGSTMNARLYWEPNPACDTTWVARPPPPYVCPELETADG
jgi:hypothetical protein